MSSKSHSKLTVTKMSPLDTNLNVNLPSGLKKGLIFRKLAQKRFCLLNVFPQCLDGLSGVETFVNFASRATWKWPFAVCWRDKAVFFSSVEKNTFGHNMHHVEAAW